MPQRGSTSTRWALLALGVFAIGWWIVNWGSDRNQILRQLGELESSLDKAGPESELVSLAEGRSALNLFAPTFALSAAPYQGRVTTANEFLLAFRRFRGVGETIDVILADQELEIQSNGTAWLLFRATVMVDLGDRSGREAYVVSSDWLKEEGDWLIREIEVLEVLGSEDGFGLFP